MKNNIPTPEVSRFSGAPWFEQMSQMSVAILGCGGIGSHAYFSIARLHPRIIKVVDFDNVEKVNMAGQMFENAHLGLPKASAMAKLGVDFSDYYDTYISCGNAQNCFLNVEGCDIIICGFDNMKSRTDIYEKWLDSYNHNNLFIDGRLTADAFQIFCISKDNEYDVKEYRKYLFSDDEADETPCSFKQTSYMASMIGSMITNIVVNYAYNKTGNTDKRMIPFMLSYNSDTMYLKVK